MKLILQKNDWNTDLTDQTDIDRLILYLLNTSDVKNKF